MADIVLPQEAAREQQVSPPFAVYELK